MENSYNDDPLGILSKPKQKQAAAPQEGGNDPLGILKKKAAPESVGTPSASGTPPTSPSKSSSSSVSAPPPVIASSGNQIKDLVDFVKGTGSFENAKAANSEAAQKAIPKIVARQAAKQKPLTESGATPRPKALSDKEAEEKAKEALSDPLMNVWASRSADPIGELQKGASGVFNGDKAFTVRNGNDASVYGQMAKIAERSFLPSEAAAAAYLKGRGVDVEGVPDADLATIEPRNVTERVALTRINQGRKIKSLLATGSVEDAAVEYAASQDPALARQIQTLGTNYQHDLPNAMQGRLISEFLENPDVIARAEADPNVKDKYTTAAANLNSNFPDYAKIRIASILSQERENRGGNNGITNIVGQKETDKLVETLIAEGKLTASDKLIYLKYIQPKLGVIQSIRRGVGRANPLTMAFTEEAPIETPGLAENFQNSLVNTLHGMAKSIEDTPSVFGAVMGGDQKGKLYDALKSDYTAKVLDPKGTWHAITQNTGHLTGFMVPMILGGEIAQGVGIPAKAASAMTAYLTFEGQNAEQALKMFPGDPTKQYLHTALATGGDMFLTELLPLAKAASGAKAALRSEITNTINSFTDGNISAAVAKETLLKKAAKIAAGLPKENAKMGATMAAFGLFHNALDAAFGGRDVSMGEVADQAVDAFKSGFLGGSLISLATAGNNQKLTGSLVREMAERPDHFKALIEQGAKMDPSLAATANERIANLNEASIIWKDVQELPLTDAQKEKYLLSALDQKVWERKAAATSDDVVKRGYQEKAKVAGQAKEAIYNGQDPATEHESFTQPEQPAADAFGYKEKIAAAKTEEEKAQIDKDYAAFQAGEQVAAEVKPEEAGGNPLVSRGEMIDQARELVRNAEIKGYTSETIKDAAENDPAKFEGYLENIAEQAKDPGSRNTTIGIYGKDIVDLAERLSGMPKEETKATPTEPGANDRITVGEVMDKPILYKGERATIYQDGKTLVAKIEGKNREYEIGNVDEVSGHSIKDYGIEQESTVVSANEAGDIVVRGEAYKNNYSDPTAAINYDAEGNVRSVNLETADGKKRTFRGNVAEDIAYQIHLKEITKNNESREAFEQFINDDAEAQQAIATAVSTTEQSGATENNSEVQRQAAERIEKVEPNEVSIPPTEASATDQGTTENSQGAKEATKFENPEEAVKHINSLPLSHVEGTRMGAKQAEGVYLSTEDANRYSSESNPARSVTVDIKNPKVTDYVENTNLQHEKIGQLLDANEISASDISSEYRPELEKFAGKRDVTNEDVSNWYRSKEGSRINEDYFEQTVRTKAAKLITEQYKSEGHDALYIPATKNTEGELIVFDSNAVKFEPASNLSKEQKYTTKTGKYSVEYRDGKRVVVDKQGNVLPEYIKVKSKKGILTDKEGNPRMVEQRNKVRDNVLREHDRAYKYNFGAKANTEEMPPNISDEQASRWVIEHSSNPAEVASIYASTPKETAKMTEIEQAIADNGVGKVKTKSYKDFGDKNNMTASKAKTYLNDKTGSSIDEIARELSDHTGLEITPQDIVDFMDRFPNGDAAVLRDGEIRQQAASKFEELTGIPLNDRVATQAALEHYSAAEREAIERDLPNEMPDDERQNWLKEIADNEYPTDNFSDFLGEPTEATGQDKGRPEIVEAATENTGTEMAGRPATSAEQGRIETADSEGENGPPAEEGSKPIGVGDSDVARLMHEDTEATREEMGLMEKRTPKEVMKDERARQEADNLINSGADFRKIAQRVLDGDGTLSTVEQVAFAKIVKAMKERQNPLDPTSAEFKDMQRDIEHLMKAADMSGSILGEQFRARQIESPYDDSMADWVLRVKEAKGVDDLSDEVLKKTKSQHNKYEAAKKNDQDTSAEVDASFSEMQADKEVKNEASKPKRQRKSKEQYGSERESIKNSIRDKWNQQGNMGDVISSGPGAVFAYAEKLTRISPDVAKLVKSYVEEGVTKLQDVIDRIHDDLKAVIPEVTKDDTRDLIAGAYREKKATRNELAAKARDLQTEAELLRKLEKLENGSVPSSQKAKDTRNQEIADLRKKIKDHGATKLSDVIKRNEQTLKNIRQRIADKDYAPDPPAPALDNPEFKRKFPELYKKALDAKVAVDDARHEFDIEVRKAELEKQSFATTAISHVGKTFRTFKALKAGIDLSAVGVQNGLAILANPVAGVKSLVKSFAAIGSNAIMDRQLARIHNSEYYDLMVKSGLSVVEPKSLKAQERDEFFADTYFDQMKVKVRGKTYDLAFTKPFERQFTALGNEMRVNLFLRRAQQLMEQGYTFANNPKEFKDAATVINTMTGRGNLAEGLSKHNSLLTTVFWSPRLMASSLNVVGLGELAWAGRLFGKETRGYYTGLTKKQAAFAVGQTVRGVGMGIAIMAAIKLFNNGDADDDPRSSTFGNVKIGDYSYNIFGRYTSFVRAFVRMLPEAIGGGKKGVEGNLKAMKPNDYAREAIQLVRGKLNPTTGLAWTIISRTDYSGRPVDYKKEFWGMFTPMSIDEISQGVKQDGAVSLLKRGLPSIIGVKVTNDKDYAKKK